jgi:hypothetical protein
MAKWKKGFRALPRSIRAHIDGIAGTDIKVHAGKKVAVEEVAAGAYAHLGLTVDTLRVGQRWEVVPPISTGTASKRNCEGWIVRRTDRKHPIGTACRISA